MITTSLAQTLPAPNIPGRPGVLDPGFTASREDEASEKKKRRQAGKLRNEKVRVRSRLRGFDYQVSRSWLYLCRQFGPDLNQDELLSIAQVVAEQANLRVDRDAKRRKNVLRKWFEENWNIISLFITRVELEDDPSE